MSERSDGEYGTAEARRRKLLMVAREIGLTDQERHELASYLLRRNISTWSKLEDEQVWRLLDALEGFELVSSLLSQRVQ